MEIEPSKIEPSMVAALADVTRQFWDEPHLRRRLHPCQRWRNALIRNKAEQRRLLQLRRQPLPKGALENSIASDIGEVGEGNGVFIGEGFWAAPAVIQPDSDEDDGGSQ